MSNVNEERKVPTWIRLLSPSTLREQVTSIGSESLLEVNLRFYSVQFRP